MRNEMGYSNQVEPQYPAGKRQLLKLLALMGALGLIIAFAPLGTLSLLIIFTLGLVSFLRPVFALYLLALLLPFNLALPSKVVEVFGIQTLLLVEILIPLLFLPLLFNLLLNDDIQRLKRALSFPLLVFLGINILSAINATSYFYYFGQIAKLITYLLFYILVVMTIKREDELRRFIRLFLASGIVVVILSLLEYFTKVRILSNIMFDQSLSFITITDGLRRLASVFGQANVFGTFLGFLALFTLGLFIEKNKSVSKNFLALYLLLVSLAILFTFSRGTILALLFALTLFAIFTLKLRWVFRIGLILLVLAISVDIFAPFKLLYVRLEEAVHLRGPALTRVNLWLVGLDMFKTHPFLGVGAGNFTEHFVKFAAQKKALEKILSEGLILSPHSIYIELLATTGLAGLASFAWVSASFFKRGLRLYKTLPDGPLRGIILGSILGLAFFILSGFVRESFADITFSLLFFMTFALVEVSHCLINEKIRELHNA